MAQFVFRGGVPVAVPDDYARTSTHQALVTALTVTNRYTDAIRILESHPESWLVADVLKGEPWAQRYLRTTARLWVTDPKLARRGVRALMVILSGRRARLGRHREPPLTSADLDRVAVAMARWKTVLEAVWRVDRSVEAVTSAAKPIVLPSAHRAALRRLLRRSRVRKSDVLLNLVSWDTGLPMRRLRAASPVADLVYG